MEASSLFQTIHHHQLEFGDRPIKLGSGSSATVYKAIWRKDENPKENDVIVAVKVYQMICDKEIDILKGLDHKNVIRFYGQYSHCLTVGLVLEFANDGDLFSYLSKVRKKKENPEIPSVRLPETQFVQWCYDAVSAVQYLHERHITHKDIKSINYLLSNDDQNGINVLKICDFGISKQTENTETIMSSVGGCTRRWASPEVNKNNKMFSPKSDIYSLCVVIWELWTCEIPWKDLVEIDITNKIIRGDLLEIPQDFPDELRPMVRKCWKMERELRCDATEVLSYLDRLKATLNINVSDCPWKEGETNILHDETKRASFCEGPMPLGEQPVDKRINEDGDNGNDLSTKHRCTYPNKDVETQDQVDVASEIVTNDDLEQKVTQENDDVVNSGRNEDEDSIGFGILEMSIIDNENEVDEENPSMMLMSQITFDDILRLEHDDPPLHYDTEGKRKSLEELNKLFKHVEESYKGLQLIKKDFIENQKFHTSLSDGEKRHLLINTADVERVISGFYTLFTESRYEVADVCELITSILDNDDFLQPIIIFCIYSHIQMNMLESLRRSLEFPDNLVRAEENVLEDEDKLSFTDIQCILLKQANWFTRFYDILKILHDAVVVEMTEDEPLIQDLRRCCHKLNDVIKNCDEHKNRIVQNIDNHSTSLIPRLRFNDENEEEIKSLKSMISGESWIKKRGNIAVLEYTTKRKGESVEETETKCVMIAFVTSVLIVQPKGEYFKVIDYIHKKDIMFKQDEYMNLECVGNDTVILAKLDPSSRYPIHEYELSFEDSNEIIEWSKVLKFSEEDKQSQDLEYFTHPETLRNTTSNLPINEDKDSSTNEESHRELEILMKITELNKTTIESISKLQQLYIDHVILSKIIGKGERHQLYYNISEVKDVIESFDECLESYRQDSCGFLTELKKRLDADYFEPVMKYIAHTCFQENMLEFQRKYNTTFIEVLENLEREAGQTKYRVSEKDLKLRLKKPVEWFTDLCKNIKELKVVFTSPGDKSLHQNCIHTEIIHMLEKLNKREHDFKKSDHITSILLNLPIPTNSDRNLIHKLCKIENDWLKKHSHMTLYEKRNSLRAARKRYHSTHVSVYAITSVIIITSSLKPNTENTKTKQFCRCYDRNYTDIEEIDSKSRESWMPEKENLFRLWIYENEQNYHFKPVEYVLELDSKTQFMAWKSALVVSTGENGIYDEYTRPVHIVCKPFKTDRENELPLEVNDYVELLEKQEAMDQEWVKGIRRRGQQTGWFPAKKLGPETESEYRTGQRVKQRFQKERERKREVEEERRLSFQSYPESTPITTKVDGRHAHSTQKRKNSLTRGFSSLFRRSTKGRLTATGESTTTKRVQSRKNPLTPETTRKFNGKKRVSSGTAHDSSKPILTNIGDKSPAEDPYMGYLRNDSPSLYQELFCPPNDNDNQKRQYVPLPPDRKDIASSDHLFYDDHYIPKHETVVDYLTEVSSQNSDEDDYEYAGFDYVIGSPCATDYLNVV